MDITPKLEPGKWYVWDFFTPTHPICGPFDTKQAAETERRSLNIDGDCYLKQAKEVTNG